MMIFNINIKGIYIFMEYILIDIDYILMINNNIYPLFFPMIIIEKIIPKDKLKKHNLKIINVKKIYI